MIKKIILWIFFILYIALLIYLTLFSKYYGRNIISREWNKEVFDNYIHNSLNLIPFKTISKYIIPIKNVLSRGFRVNILGNLIAFMPFAFFLPKLFKRQNNLKVFTITMILIVLVIELLQFLTLAGCCDIDDLILNVLGAVIMFQEGFHQTFE